MGLFNTEALMQGLSIAILPQVITAVVLGLIVGVTFGAMPGIKGSTAIAIMLPFVYYFEPIVSILFLSSIYTGASYGGGILAVLMGMPGTSGAVATVFDGYEMTKRGRQNEALGIGLMSSAIGAFLGWIIVFFTIRSIGLVVLKFGPAELLMLMLFSISVIGMLKGEISKSLLMGLTGLLLGTVGASAYGKARGTFGNILLLEGLPLAPVTIGTLAISMIIILVGKKSVFLEGAVVQTKFSDILKGFRYPLKDKLNAFSSGLIGVLIGMLPAAGASIAASLAYGFAQTRSKNKDNFGSGEPSGVVAAETANNACEGGSMATMMAFGIPGSGTGALMMAAFLMVGYVPGPYLMRENLDVVYAVIWANLYTAILLIPVALLFIHYFSRVIFIPPVILSTVITVLAVIGAFGGRMLYIDVLVLCVFALFGYLLRKADYPVLALVLGFILGGMVDAQFTRTVALYSGRWEILLRRPLFLVLFALNILVFVSPAVRWIILRNKKGNAVE